MIAAAPNISVDIRDALLRIGAQVREVPLCRTGMNPLRDAVTIVSLVNLLNSERPDFLITYTVKPNLYGAIAGACVPAIRVFSMITGLGFWFSRHEGLRYRVVSPWVMALFRLAMRLSEGVIFQNPDDPRELVTRGLLSERARVHVASGSGVDVEHFAPVPLPSDPVFLLIARLIKEKGLLEFVDAARLVRAKHPSAKFRVAGWLENSPSAIGRGELNEWIQEGVVEYLGRLDDVRPAMRECRVYVLPSYREGTPRSVLEAMSMGRPVITTDAPGCRETVSDGENGFLVPVRDVRGLAEAMSRFIETPELAARMGAASRRIAEERYDVWKVNAEILQFIGL